MFPTLPVGVDFFPSVASGLFVFFCSFMKRSEPKDAMFDSVQSQHEAHNPAKRQKKSALSMKLYDIASIRDRRGDVDFYRDRFFAWRRVNRRDDPTQSLADKTNSWRTFVRLENEGKIDSILQKVNLSARRGSQTQRTPDRSSIGKAEATVGSRTRERHRERQPRGSHDFPKCLRSADSHANARGRSDSSASSSASTVSDHPDGPRSTQPATDDLRESQSSEVGLNAKTIERLWKWKSAHRLQIAELSQHCSDLTARCESLEARCESLEARCGALEDRLDLVASAPHSETALQTIHADLRGLQQREKERDSKQSRLLGAVDDAGSVLDKLRGELEARLAALESVKEQSFDVLQRLHAESQLQTTEMARLREQVDAVQHDLERLRRNH